MVNEKFLLQQLLSFSELKMSDDTQKIFKISRKKLSGTHTLSATQHLNLLKSIADKRAQGDTFSSIAVSLNAQGSKGGYGARWYAASVYRYLHRHSKKAFPDPLAVTILPDNMSLSGSEPRTARIGYWNYKTPKKE